MNRSFFFSFFLFFPVLFASTLASANDSPDPFGPGTLQARALRGLPGEVAALILRADPGGELSMEVLALPLPPDAGWSPDTDTDTEAPGAKRRVMVLVEVDGTSFLELNREETARLEVYLYALKDQGYQVADYRAEVTAVEVGSLGEIIWQSGLKYYGELMLEPGTYRLRALIRDFHSKAAGLREVSIAVSDEPSPLMPLFPDPVHRESWLPIRAWRDDLLSGLLDEPVEGLRQRDDRAYPFAIAEEAIKPSTRPVLIPGRNSTVYLHGSLTPDQSYELVITDTGSDPKILANVPLEVQDRVEKPGGVFLEARFQLPTELKPGPVILRSRILQGGETADSPGIQAHLMGSDIRDQNLLWSDLKWRGASETEAFEDTTSARISEAPRKKGGRRVDKLAREYRELIASLQSIGKSPDINSLLEFETRVINEGSKKASAQLQVAEMQVAEALAEVDPESLVPLIQLHQDLYVAYRGRRLFSLGTHSRVLMERMAELYAEKGNSQGSNIVAARALTSIGGHLQAGGLAATSQRLFRRSLELHPASKTAMVALACGYERLGAYGRARDILENMVAQHPGVSEGWLRLATSVARLGNREQSRELLEKTIHLKGPDWIRALAYEELARIHLLFDRVTESLELLEEIPNPSPGTRVLMAYLYDRLGSPNQSLELLQSIEGRSHSGPSPRKRYDGWPDTMLKETRSQLLEAATIRLSRLQQSVKG